MKEAFKQDDKMTEFHPLYYMGIPELENIHKDYCKQLKPILKSSAVLLVLPIPKRIVSDTQNRILNPEGRTVLFVDEIHRFNKAQQDALLPYVEDGTIILVGATTENPYFEVNKALISRSSVFMLKPLGSDSIKKIIKNALGDKERGLEIEIVDEALDYLAYIY